MGEMKISAIVAIDENGAIGRAGGLLCRLSADLQRFKSITMGHPIIMGRKTFCSFPKGPLPGRKNIVLTRDASFKHEGVTVCHSVEEAIEAASVEGADECFVIGGGEIYARMMGMVSKLYVTRIHARHEGADTFFPAISEAEWVVTNSEWHPADERNEEPYSFVTMERRAI